MLEFNPILVCSLAKKYTFLAFVGVFHQFTAYSDEPSIYSYRDIVYAE